MADLGRADIATTLDADAGLDGWHVYDEPPEQLVGPRCIIVAPRSPYQDWDTYTTLRTHLSVHVCVIRAHGPAMDAVDAGLAAVRAALAGTESVDIGSTTSVGLLQDIGGPEYIVATLEVTVERANP